MAEIVGRIALSHAPQLLMRPDKWQTLPSRMNEVLPERPELEPEVAEE